MNIKKVLKNLKLHESAISMILGAIVVIVTGTLIVNYFDGRTGETTSMETENFITLPTTHKIEEGEDLWSISEKYYGTGYNWVDIARENKVTNPDQISTGQELVIPDVEVRLANANITPIQEVEVISPTLTPQKNISKNKVHKVVRGESLWSIAEKYYKTGYDWVKIAKENNLAENNIIEEGQEIIIPEIESLVVVEDNIQKDTIAISGNSYEVVKGDSLWDIAVRAYGDGYKWIEIAKENNLINPGIIHPGNILTLPR